MSPSGSAHTVTRTLDSHVIEVSYLVLPGETVPTGPPGPSYDLVVTGDTGAAYALDAAEGTYFALVLTDDCVFTIADDYQGRSFVVQLEQTASFAATWPVTVSWPGVSPHEVTEVPGAMDVIVFVSMGAGTWIGLVAGTDIL